VNHGERPGAGKAKPMEFRIASVSKLFTAVAVLELVGQGSIRLADPISKYLPRPNAHIADWNSITIGELGNHTSGLTYDFDLGSDVLRNPRHPWTTAELSSHVVQCSAAGTEGNYANANYMILKLLVEKLTRRSLGGFISLRVTGPIGCDHTGMPSDGFEPEMHGFSGLQDVTNWSPSWASGAGDMVSNVRDLARWIRALGSGKLLGPKEQRTLLQVVRPSTDTGFGVQECGAGWIGHTGRIYGYASGCFYNSRLDAAVAVVVNRFDVGDIQNGRNVARELPILEDVAESFFPGYPIDASRDKSN
jgi:D-alanyl-D-alanine carboxypeptidase